MNKQDLTRYSDEELSLVVFNTERLYKMRNDSGLIDELSCFFYFTKEQLKVLQDDLLEDMKG